MFSGQLQPRRRPVNDELNGHQSGTAEINQCNCTYKYSEPINDRYAFRLKDARLPGNAFGLDQIGIHSLANLGLALLDDFLLHPNH